MDSPAAEPSGTPPEVYPYRGYQRQGVHSGDGRLRIAGGGLSGGDVHIPVSSTIGRENHLGRETDSGGDPLSIGPIRWHNRWKKWTAKVWVG